MWYFVARGHQRLTSPAGPFPECLPATSLTPAPPRATATFLCWLVSRAAFTRVVVVMITVGSFGFSEKRPIPRYRWRSEDGFHHFAQRCQAGYSWASQSAGALCGAKVNVSTRLACSIAARLVVNHWPLMYIIKTPNKSNNKPQKTWLVMLRFCFSHSQCLRLIANWNGTFSLSVLSVVVLLFC